MSLFLLPKPSTLFCTWVLNRKRQNLGGESSFIYLPSKEGTQQAGASKTCAPLWAGSEKFLFSQFKAGIIGLWTFFSMVDGEVTGSQHHQLSGSFRSRVFMLVGTTPSLIVSFSFLDRVSVPAKQLNNIVSLEGESGPCPKTALLFPEYSSLVAVSAPFPS